MDQNIYPLQEVEFARACQFVRGAAARLSNEDLLYFYARFKQAILIPIVAITYGDASCRLIVYICPSSSRIIFK